jgi:uncharacterized membrane protein YeaQ/YmgE (transglycosylase-associated protein family)
MMPAFHELAIWVVVGLIGGGLAGAATTWERRGYGLLRNLALGLAGALLGGFLFRALDVWPALSRYSISLREIVAAFIGSLIVLLLLYVVRRWLTSRRQAALPEPPVTAEH